MRQTVSDDVADQFSTILDAYLTEGNDGKLESAYEFGRQAMREGKGLVETVDTHFQALERLLVRDCSPQQCERLRKAFDFLTDALSPFEMAYRGFEEANATLCSLNESLEERVRERTGALSQSEARYRQLLEMLPAAAYTCDAEGLITFYNRRAVELWGREPKLGDASDRFCGSLRMFSPEGSPVPHDQCWMALALRENKALPGREIVVERPDGEKRTVLAYANPIHNEAGESIGMVNVLVDITDRKRVEGALRESETRFARFMQHLPGLAWIKDLKGRYVFANDSAARAFRTRRSELYGKTDDELFPPETAAQFKNNDRRALASPNGIQTVETLEHEDGVVHHSLVSKFPIHAGNDGRPALVGGMAIDITERVQAEEMVRQSHAVLNAVVEGTTDAVYVKDGAGRYLMINTAGARFLGKGVEEVVGKTDVELFTPATGRQLMRHDRRIMASGKTETFEETGTAAGATRTYLSTKGPYYVDGRLRGVIGISRDITERQRIEESTRFLSEATTVLASSLDYETTLASVARLLVPRQADWCSLVLADEEGLQLVTVVHSDPKKVKLASELRRRFTPKKDSPYGAAAVIRTGEPQLFAEITSELLETTTRDAEHLHLLKGLGLHSALVVPLTARGRVFGALTWVMAESSRRYSEADLPFAQELARRCAIAVDNARLYQSAGRELAERRRAEAELEALNRTLEQRVAEQTARVRLLHEVAILANLAESFDEAARAVVEHLSRHMDCAVGHVFMVPEEGGGKLVSAPIWYFDEPARFDRLREITEKTRFQAGTGIPGRVLASARPQFLLEIAAVSNFRRILAARKLGLCDGFAFPVLVGKRVAAVLEFFSVHAIQRSDELLDLMAHVGTQLGRVVERQEATEHLLKTNKLLATSQQLAHIGSWQWDVASNRVSWTDELYRIYGLEPQQFEATLEGFLERVHPEDRPRVRAAVETALKTAQPFSMDERIVRDGEVRTLHSQAEVVTDQAENVLRMFGTCQDITEARQQEQALRASELRFRSVWENSADGMRLTDAEGTIVAVNEAYAKLVGIPAGELEGKPFSVVYSDGRETEKLLAKYRARFRKDRGPRHFERRVPFRTRTLDLLMTNSVIELGSGTPLLLSIFRDITDLKAAAERALRAERLAAIGQMITGLAHESRNALQRSQACLERLTWKVEGRPDELELVKRIQQAQRDLHRTYEDVRQYAAPINLGRERHDLGRLLDETWDELDGLRKGRQAVLRRSADRCDLDAVVDPFAIKQVFRNVLENALAACADPLEIDVQFAESEIEGVPGLSVAIGDNGPGLTEETRRRIFEPFYTTKSRGTGLGMAIAKRIIETHRGRIDVGIRGRGAEIILVVPRT